MVKLKRRKGSPQLNIAKGHRKEIDWDIKVLIGPNKLASKVE